MQKVSDASGAAHVVVERLIRHEGGHLKLTQFRYWYSGLVIVGSALVALHRISRRIDFPKLIFVIRFNFI